MTLWGRRQQCEAIDGLLADVRAGRSRALVVRGEPGIGNTALLGYAVDTAQDFRVARAEGVESEMELPFAALHQLTGRMLGRLDALPGPQRDALGVAFGMLSGSVPDRFLVGLAVLGLLSEVAAAQLPGRFDRQVTIPLPTLPERVAILAVHCRDKKLGPDVDLSVVARGTPGFSQVMAKLEDGQAGRVLAAEDGEVVGIITSSDLTRWLHRWRVLKGRALDSRAR